MEIWSEARERYVRGGVTQREVARMFELPLGTLRKRAAAEGWSMLRESRAKELTAENGDKRKIRVERQLKLTDRMLDVLEKALEDEDELYGWIEFWKTTSTGEFVSDRLGYLNDERFGRFIKAASDIFELQRIVLGIHDYRDELSAQKLENDADIARSKLEQQAALAGRKLELELLRLENAQECAEASDDFLAALGMKDGDEDGSGQEE